MIVTVCTFKRRPRDKWEEGIAIGADTDDITTVIDRDGNRVNILSDYKITPQEGCFNVSFESADSATVDGVARTGESQS